jgi:nicotinate-nucleotide pyrophosphorylase (carboxylating)
MDEATRELIRRALAEDLGGGDLTSSLCVPETLEGTGRIRARAPGILSGVEVAAAVFTEVDPAVEVSASLKDGEGVAAGSEILRLRGRVRSLLAAERVALNFLAHLSGIATLTRRFVEAVGGRIEVRDTRKTIPGLRALEKAAVRHGGGVNHRSDLAEAAMIKDNHVLAAGGLEAALRRVLGRLGRRPLVVECRTLEEARLAARMGAGHLLLDNMGPEGVAEVARTLSREGRRPFLEASGGITLETAPRYAESGVDAISVGALTHSAPALDVGLDLDPSFREGR